MTEDIFPEEAFKAFNPENVAPAALCFWSPKMRPQTQSSARARGVCQSSFVTMNEGVLLGDRRAHGRWLRRRLGQDQRPHRRCADQNGMEQSMHAMGMLQKAAEKRCATASTTFSKRRSSG